MKVSDLMTKNVITIPQNATIEDVVKILSSNRISGAPVVDDNGVVIGIISEGDLLYREISPRLPDAINVLDAIIFYSGIKKHNEGFKKILAGQASDIMTREVISVEEDTEITEVARLMLKHNIKRIPVISDNKIKGIISRADVIRKLLW